jgi:hypothetical protein
MFADTEQKKARLDAKRPFPEDVKDYADGLALLDFAYTNLKLDGSSLTAEGVNQIIGGDIVSGVSLREHNEVEYHRHLLRAFADMLYMGTAVDRKELIRLYSILTHDPHATFRSGSPILYHLDYTPPHCADIPERLDQLFRDLFAHDFGGDYIRRAVEMHDGIIAVYPFSERTEALARAALQYELLRNGMPIIPFGLTEQAYNEMTAAGVKNGAHDELYAAVLRAADKKLDLLLRLFS